MTEHLEPLRVVAHRARLLAAGEVNAQTRQEFLRIAEKLEAEALAEVPGELRPQGNSRTVIEAEPEDYRPAEPVHDGDSGNDEPPVKKRRRKKNG